MKAKGPRFERETVIVQNEVDDMASVWTASQHMYNKLKKLGYAPIEDSARSASFKVLKKYIKVRRTVATSKKRLAALERARTLREACSDGKPLKLQRENGQTGPSMAQ